MSNIIDLIRTIPNLYHANPCTQEQVQVAQEELGLIFPKEYVEYVTAFGAISFFATEWTGLNVSGELNTVNRTQAERQVNENFPNDFFALEDWGIDAKLAVANQAGEVFLLQYEKLTPICNSITEYLRLCIARKEES